ncbi:hypothetical protein ACQPW3_06385 [Actinosynnema sp. CA-248983]
MARHAAKSWLERRRKNHERTPAQLAAEELSSARHRARLEHLVQGIGHQVGDRRKPEHGLGRWVGGDPGHGGSLRVEAAIGGADRTLVRGEAGSGKTWRTCSSRPGTARIPIDLRPLRDMTLTLSIARRGRFVGLDELGPGVKISYWR